MRNGTACRRVLRESFSTICQVFSFLFTVGAVCGSQLSIRMEAVVLATKKKKKSRSNVRDSQSETQTGVHGGQIPSP